MNVRRRVLKGMMFSSVAECAIAEYRLNASVNCAVLMRDANPEPRAATSSAVIAMGG